MLKSLLFVVMGFASFAAGFYLFFTEMNVYANGGSGFLLLLGFPFLAVSAVFIYLASKKFSMTSQYKESDNAEVIVNPKFEDKLKQHEEIVKSWNNTTNTRDKLKFMKFAQSQNEEEQKR